MNVKIDNNSLIVGGPILQTKLHPPPLRAGIIARHHLWAKLAEKPFRLGVVTAPAGFGKSTTIRSWLETIQTGYTWLSLDERDNSLSRFLTYLIAALQRFDKLIGATSLDMLKSDTLPAIEILMTPIINELCKLANEVIVVLDDYHLIEAPSVHDAVRFAVDQLPPNICLLLLSRVDPAFPMAKYRARDELMEIREEDLRFTEEEAEQFLNGEMKLGLTEAHLKTLNAKTEGWAAGLQLASLSLQQSQDKDAFLQSFSGETGYVLDYLMEEVFAGLSEDVQYFLLRTSILSQFNVELAAQVSGIEDTVEILNKLEEQNLFLVPLDEKSEWFRYHHLFGELLQFRLKQNYQDEIDKLCGRASDWYQSNGQVDQALDYAFRMTEKSRAFALLDRYTEHLISQSRLTEFRRWVEQVPEDAIADYPTILLGRAWMQLLSHRSAHIGQDIETIRKVLDSEDCLYSEERKQTVHFFTKILQAFWYRVSGDLQRAIILSERTLEAMPEGRPIFRGMLLYNMTRSYIKVGHVQKPIMLFEQIIGESAGKGNYYLLLSSRGHLCTLMIQSDGPAAAAHRAQKYLNELQEQGLHNLPAACYLYNALGYAGYIRNDIEAAEEALENALRLAKQGDDPYVRYQSLLTLAMCDIAVGEKKAADTYLSEAARLFHESEVGIFGSDLKTDQLYLDALAGDFTRIGPGLKHLGLEPEADFSVIRERQGIIAIRHAIHTNDAKRAREYIQWLRPYIEDFQRKHSLLVLDIYTVLLTLIVGEEQKAYENLTNVLQSAAAREEVMPFLEIGEPMRKLLKKYLAWDGTPNTTSEFARMLLSELQQQTHSHTIPKFQQDLIEPLTEREQEVLSHLLERKTYQEIANTMFVSVNSVKTHLKNLYAKLNVGNKSEAVDKARSMGFLED